MRMCCTSASVRISTPAFLRGVGERVGERAEAAAGKSGGPDRMGIGGGAQQQYGGDAADQGPRAVPKMPRAAITARINSVSKNSATKSATAMGPQRSRSKMPSLPRPRTLRPVLNRFQRSSGEGYSMSGGVMERNLREDLGDVLEGVGEFRVFSGVFGGETRDATSSLGMIVVEEQRFAVRRGRENAWIGIIELQCRIAQVACHGQHRHEVDRQCAPE